MQNHQWGMLLVILIVAGGCTPPATDVKENMTASVEQPNDNLNAEKEFGIVEQEYKDGLMSDVQFNARKDKLEREAANEELFINKE